MHTNRKVEKIPEDQLKIQLDAVKAHIRRTNKHGGDTRDAEVELCYLEREEEHRSKAQKLCREYREYLDCLRREEIKEAKEEEEAIKEYWNSDVNLGLYV